MIIYKLTNKYNEKVYIGLTTVTLNQRLKQHHYDSRHGVDRPLYRAMRKYGEDAFVAEIIDTASSLEELKQKEQYWIKYYDSYGPNGHGYNATIGGDVRTHPCVPYIKIDLRSGKVLKEYERAELCNQEHNGATQSADKIIQVQYTDYIIVKKEKIKDFTDEQIKDYAFSLRPKVICQLDKNNNLIRRWINTSEILKEHPDYTKSCIMACLWGKRKTHKKYQWKYYQDWRDSLSNIQV